MYPPPILRPCALARLCIYPAKHAVILSVIGSNPFQKPLIFVSRHGNIKAATTFLLFAGDGVQLENAPAAQIERRETLSHMDRGCNCSPRSPQRSGIIPGVNNKQQAADASYVILERLHPKRRRLARP